MKLGMEVGLGPGHIVLDGDPPPGPTQIFGPRLLGQTAGWIKMSLGREVGLSPGDIVLDGDRTPPKRSTAVPPHPHFSAHFYCSQTVAHLATAEHL